MRRLLVALAAAVVLPVVVAMPAAAQRDAPDPFGSPVYLALGDSVAAGVGARPYVTGYPEQLAALLGQGYNRAADRATPNASADIEVTNRAVGGATTSTLIAGQLPDAVQLITERNDNGDPFDDVEVVTVTIGGNDVFGPVVGACVTASSTAGCQAAVDTALATAGGNLADVLGQLTAAADRDTEVVVTTYYNPIGSCVLGQANPAAVGIADIVLEGGSLPGVLTVDEGLNDLIRDAAGASGAQAAELYGALGAGEYVGGNDCLHPNLA